MKVKCSKCKHVISVSDEKLEGKEGKIKLRCPSCKTPLAVRLPSKTAGAQEGEAVWYYSLDGNQEGPVTAPVLKSLIADGKVHGGTDVWRPGLDEWVKASTLEELWDGATRTTTLEAPIAAASDIFSEKTMEIDAANLEDLPRPEAAASRAEAPSYAPTYSDSDPSLDPAKAALERSKAMLEQAASAPAPEPILFPAASQAPAPKKEEEEDLFGSFGAGSSSQDDDEGVDAANLAHTRRETSVLFSLDDMKGKKGKKAKAAVEHDSGLIDIRQMAVERRDDDIFASFGGGQTAAEEPSHLMGAGGQNSIATAALNVPILKRKKKWPFVVAAVTVGLIVVIGVGGFYVAFNAFFGPGSPKWLEDQLRAAHTNALNDATTLSKKASEELAAQKDSKLKEVEGKIEALRTEHDKRYAMLDSEADKARKEVQAKFDEEIGALNKEKADLQEKLVAMAGEKKVVVVQQPVPGEVKNPENPTPPVNNETPPAGDGGKKPNSTTTNPKTNNPKTNNPKTNNPTDAGGTQGGKTPTNPTNPTNSTTGNEVKNPTNNEAADILGKIDGGTGGDTGDGGTAKKALTTTDVTKAVAEARPGMKDCFSQYAGELEGATIRARLTIAPNGEVTGVVIASAEYAGTALGNCVRDKMNKMKFPAFSGSPVTKTISVRLP